jgi:hypothetical protein
MLKVSTLGFHARNAEDRLPLSYFLPHLTEAFYHDFLGNVLLEPLHYVNLQTKIHLWFTHDGVPPYLLLQFGILEQCVSGTVDRTRWTKNMTSYFP